MRIAVIGEPMVADNPEGDACFHVTCYGRRCRAVATHLVQSEHGDLRLCRVHAWIASRAGHARLADDEVKS